VSRAARVVSRRGTATRAYEFAFARGFVLWVFCSVRRASRERQNSEDRNLACFAWTDATYRLKCAFGFVS
jgi:hypothetical protein